MCKDRIEQEEAEELAKVRSMEVQDIPHPALSGLAPPTPEVLIHVQTIGDKHNVSHCISYLLQFVIRLAH